MFTFFITIAIFLYYIICILERGIKEKINYNKYLGKKNSFYYDTYGKIRDIETKQPLFYKTINGKRNLVFANETVHTTFDNGNDKTRNDINKQNKERAIQDNKKGYLYFPSEKEKILGNNYYYISFDSNEKYVYKNGVLLFYNTEANNYNKIITDKNLIQEYI